MSANAADARPIANLDAQASRQRRQPAWLSAFRGYSILVILVGLGWLLRERQLITPEEGIGYWLGIIGGSLMLVLLLYPVRKRFRMLRWMGETRHWFKMHMIFGLVGPLLILYHCNFSLGSFNSQVALYCMLLVTGSGLVGRYIYAHIHRGLYGRKTSLQELQAELAKSLEHSHGLARLMPELVGRLDAMSAELQGDTITGAIGLRRSMVWTIRRVYLPVSLLLTAWRELGEAAAESPAMARNQRRLRKTAARYINRYTYLMGRVAQFSLFERMFSLWHILHLPIFYMMVLSALVHVLAVHMY